nr:DUF177 domain-containing protein [Pontibacter harenae]
MLTFHFDIKGHVRLICDRSLEEFDYPLDIQQVFRIRYGEEDAELDDDLWQIKSNTQSINIAQHLYDYIGLSLPMKKLHPRFVEEMENDEDNDEDILIYSSRDHDKEGDDENDEDDEDDDIDPRWNALRNLN